MAKAKKPSRKRSGTRKRPLKRPPLGSQLLRVVAGVVLLVALVLTAVFLTHHFMVRKQPVAPLPAPTAGKPTPPTFEVYPKRDEPVRPPIPEAPPPARLPQIAIIVDDVGYDRLMAERFLDLDAVLTFSILPFGPFSERIAAMAKEKGMEVMLHLPMEPDEYPNVNPGPGALLSEMSPDELIRQLTRDLEAVPSAVGVNNHMGSKMTTNSIQIYQVFSVLKKRGLFFIDSRTTAETICRPSARLFQLPFAERDVFLDHVQDGNFIRKQLRQLVETARSHGEAIGIAHPHELTLEILKEKLPELKEHVTLVPASRVVRSAG